MKTQVEFKSSAFPKYENEDEETVNPNRWGKRFKKIDTAPTVSKVVAAMAAMVEEREEFQDIEWDQ